MLSSTQLLDDPTIESIMSSKPFSRLPVYSGNEKNNIIGWVWLKANIIRFMQLSKHDRMVVYVEVHVEEHRWHRWHRKVTARRRAAPR